MSTIKTIQGDSEKEIKKMPDESIDIICIDPPYLYLKKQRLERPFNENAFFTECKRVLTKEGFIIMFGRGSSFYRWNTILAELGFTFKEEIIWDKRMVSSPLMALSRVHETVSIHTKGKASINNVKVPYLEMKGHNIDGIVRDIERLRRALNNPQSLKNIQTFLEWRQKGMDDVPDNVEAYNPYGKPKQKTGVTVRNHLLDFNRCLSVAKAIEKGQNEKSIICQTRDHYSVMHPTQKPVRLIERLLALCVPSDKNPVVVADFFAGSFSCGVACWNMGLDFIGIEIDEEYYKAGAERIAELTKQPKLF